MEWQFLRILRSSLWIYIMVSAEITIQSLITELRLNGFSDYAYGFSGLPYGFPVQVLTDGEITADVTE